ncbi:MAG: hypothetical protein ABFD92_16850 [Planctomycetaceae bacterium]|nr:hypothetical protein [Planctomycetaceae bacterium]
MGTYKNPQSVAIGSVAFTDVLEISSSCQRPEVVDPIADAETYVKGASYGGGLRRGTITFRNPAAAKAAAGLIGTLTATLKGNGGAADKTLTIANIRLGGDDWNAGHDRTSTATVPWMAQSADGTTDPETIA